jgi:hypothetical protein
MNQILQVSTCKTLIWQDLASASIQLYPKKDGFQFGFRFYQPKPKLKPIN